jgi:hypothetical protein
MDRDAQKHLAANESVFREVNEGIQRGHWPGDERTPVGFRCECARMGCNAIVTMTATDYERIRANPRWFFVVPGHELPDVENVVESNQGYVVVEKRSEAGRIAVATDPRR